MTRFEALKSVTGVREFSTLICDILNDKKNADDITEFWQQSYQKNSYKH